jgi:hypothetical protein
MTWFDSRGNGYMTSDEIGGKKKTRQTERNDQMPLIPLMKREIRDILVSSRDVFEAHNTPFIST